MNFQLQNENVIKSVIRLKKIEFKNFRNIGKGCISFPNTECDDIQNNNPSILGLYGQNGSGKSSVIMALGILKCLLTGKAISPRYYSCIRQGYDRCSLAFTLGNYESSGNDELMSKAQQTEMFYSFDMVNKPDMVLSDGVKNIPDGRIFVENEVLQIRCYLPDGTILMPKQVLVDTSINNSNKKGFAFGNATKYSQFIGDSKEKKQELLLLKKKNYINGKSFIFSEDLLKYILDDAYDNEFESIMDVAFRVNEFVDLFMGTDENPDASLGSLLEAFKTKSNGDLLKRISAYIDTDDSFDDEDELVQSFVNLLMTLIREEDNVLCKFNPDHKAWQKEKVYSFDEAYTELLEREKILAMLLQRNGFGALIRSLMFYGSNCLHIVDTSITGQTNMNSSLPLFLWDCKCVSGRIEVDSECINLNMDEKTGVPIDKFALVEKSIASINTALTELVPNVQLGFEDIGVDIDDKGVEKHYFEIQSVKNNVRIPLKFESDGVRRIVSLTSLFIAVYNEPSFTMAIDEIDSGIFEYLLGELFHVLAESAQGQFIFTSHNLRPLEVLPAKYLCFTTVNPDKRFVKLSNRGNSNLRDTYIRMIVLGAKGEEVYNSTDRYLLSRALYKAGNIRGTE